MRIKAVIFDVGGVLNQGESDFIQCFSKNNIALKKDLLEHNGCKQLIINFCTGKYGLDKHSAEKFFEDIRIQASLDKTVGFEQFKQAWNAAIICLNYDLIDNLNLLKEQGYRLFILSDNNLLHQEYEETLYQRKHPQKTLRSLFERCYFSHETGHYKGFAGEGANQAWLQILHENNLKAHECLFIDDKLEHINKAIKLGLSGLHYKNDCTSQTLFDVLRAD